jgi:hypothetical protein
MSEHRKNGKGIPVPVCSDQPFVAKRSFNVSSSQQRGQAAEQQGRARLLIYRQLLATITYCATAGHGQRSGREASPFIVVRNAADGPAQGGLRSRMQLIEEIPRARYY